MMRGYPAAKEAERLLQEAKSCNPGPWSDHSRIAALCAKRIAQKADLNTEKAYVLGLLHDIGRKFGKGHLTHVYDGWRYMQHLGYHDVARICLTHSFTVPTLQCYIGNYDIPQARQQELEDTLAAIVYDDYDRLIQLCDCLAGTTGVMDMEERMADVKQRYGNYPQEKWDANMALKTYFEEKTGSDLYDLVR